MSPGTRWQEMARRAAMAAVSPVPPSLVLAAIERVAPRLAQIGLRTDYRGFPRYLRRFPDRLAPFFGTVLGKVDERARLIEARLRFILVRALVHQMLAAQDPAEAARRLGPIEMRGEDRFEAARAEGRGVILASAHFGLPAVIRLAIEERGVPVVGIGGRANRVEVTLGRDVWTNTRGLTRMREELAAGHVCIILLDVRRGRYSELPFLSGRMPVTVGAFRIAQMTGSPLLPAFGIMTDSTPRFRVEVGPPLAIPDRRSTAPFTDATATFIRAFEDLGKRYPAQLFGYEPVFVPSSTRAPAPSRPRS
jgi:lauroyl/myristoyl acyltransferase